MGREVERVARSRGHRVIGAIHPSAARAAYRRISKASLRGAAAAIEFTEPDASVDNLGSLVREGCRSIVVGTTGWKARLPEVERLVRDSGVGLVHADNFSVGMTLFAAIVRHTSKLFLSRGYDPYIVEWHHRGKRDAPSGTARMLATIIESSDRGRRRREGPATNGLEEGEFTVASIRAGAIPGTHLVGFDSGGDAVELTHTARGRAGFALGAVLAAEWLRGRKGLFTFENVLEDFA